MRRLSLVVVGAVMLMSMGCGNSAKSPPKSQLKAPTAAVSEPVKQVPSAPMATRNRQGLARVFALSRCVMIGVLSADPKHYTDHGFADDAAFRSAFAAESKLDAMWARGVVQKAMTTPCAGATKARPEKKP